MSEVEIYPDRVSEATLKDLNGKLPALGTETCSIFPAGNLAER